jgi:hypothetical protein
VRTPTENGAANEGVVLFHGQLQMKEYPRQFAKAQLTPGKGRYCSLCNNTWLFGQVTDAEHMPRKRPVAGNRSGGPCVVRIVVPRWLGCGRSIVFRLALSAAASRSAARAAPGCDVLGESRRSCRGPSPAASDDDIAISCSNPRFVVRSHCRSCAADRQPSVPRWKCRAANARVDRTR